VYYAQPEVLRDFAIKTLVGVKGRGCHWCLIMLIVLSLFIPGDDFVIRNIRGALLAPRTRDRAE
jgi:hypothetical protein